MQRAFLVSTEKPITHSTRTVCVARALDTQVLEGLAATARAVGVHQAFDAGTEAQVAVGLEVQGRAVRVASALDADAGGCRADGMSASGAIAVGLARGGTSMGAPGADFAVLALRCVVAFDALSIVPVTDGRRAAAIR